MDVQGKEREGSEGGMGVHPSKFQRRSTPLLECAWPPTAVKKIHLFSHKLKAA